ISSSDIVYFANSDQPFTQQVSTLYAAAYGQDVRISGLSDAGITGSRLPNGDTTRLGKMTDPAGSGKQVGAHELGVGDPITQGSHRAEMEFSDKKLIYGQTYWFAYRMYVYDWGTLPSGDEQLFGFQFHNGNTDAGFSPSVAITAYGAKDGGRSFQM